MKQADKTAAPDVLPDPDTVLDFAARLIALGDEREALQRTEDFLRAEMKQSGVDAEALIRVIEWAGERAPDEIVREIRLMQAYAEVLGISAADWRGAQRTVVTDA